MIALREFMKAWGLVSAKDLQDFYGPEFDFKELYKMIEEQEVSCHTERFGRKMYRFPFLEARAEGTSKRSCKFLLSAIREKPGRNATALRNELNLSQKLFEMWEQELLAEDLIYRTKRGTSWLYFLVGEEPLEDLEVPEFLNELFFIAVEAPLKVGFSVKTLAKECGVSRETFTKAYDWLMEEGLLYHEDGLVKTIYPGTHAERREFNDKWFPKMTDLQRENTPFIIPQVKRKLNTQNSSREEP